MRFTFHYHYIERAQVVFFYGPKKKEVDMALQHHQGE